MNGTHLPVKDDRIRWLSDLIRLEITLWNQIDQQLQDQHHLPLSLFESLYLTHQATEGRLRVGELAEALRITVGGTSKIVDKLDQMGFIRREPDPQDRRASRIALTPAGTQVVVEASRTYEAALAALLNPVLTPDEQRQFHQYVTRLLRA